MLSAEAVAVQRVNSLYLYFTSQIVIFFLSLDKKDSGEDNALGEDIALEVDGLTEV